MPYRLALLALMVLALPGQAMGQLCGTQIDPASIEPALLSIRAAQRGELRVASKSAAPPEIGDRQQFNVYVYASNRWSPKEFVLRDKTSLYYAWVEVANQSALTESELATIRLAMMSQTPVGSVDPTRGVLQNNIALFGSPPNLDGDGITDFLFYDIDNQNVGGFVSSGDLAVGAGGNERDVLHLDIFQSISFMPRLIAHEFTHLIHFNYGFDSETFVSEGLAEYAMVANGYIDDNYQFLGLPSETKRPLYSWRGVDSPNGGRDYDRSRLFFSYIGDRIGPYPTGSMVRMSRKGPAGMKEVLAEHDITLGGLIGDYHAANWIGDSSIGPEFAYKRSFSPPLAVLATQQWNTATTSFTPEMSESDRPTVELGAVNYVRWGELANLDLSVDAVVSWNLPDSIRTRVLADMRARMAIRMVATRDDDRNVLVDVPVPGSYRLKGNYKEVRVIVTSSDPDKTITYAMDASWRQFGTATGVETAETPPAEPHLSVFPNPGSGLVTVEWGLADGNRASLRVLDLLGRTVALPFSGFRTSGIRRETIDLSQLSSGTYLVVLDVDGRQKTLPLVVMR